MCSRWSISQHEAAHVIAAWYCGRTIRVESASVAALSGNVTWLSARLLHKTDASLWARLVIALAGIAGEFRAGRRVRASSCSDDLLRADQYAVALVRQCDIFEALPFETDGRRTIVRMFAEAPPAAVEHALEAAYYKARLLIRCYSPEWRLLSFVLYVFGELRAAELGILLGPRPFYRVFVLSRERRWWLRMPGRMTRFLLGRAQKRILRMKGWWRDGGTRNLAE